MKKLVLTIVAVVALLPLFARNSHEVVEMQRVASVLNEASQPRNLAASSTSKLQKEASQLQNLKQDSSFFDRFDRLMKNQHYTAAFTLVAQVAPDVLGQPVRKSAVWSLAGCHLEDLAAEGGLSPDASRMLLLSSWCMVNAANGYQEDVFDSMQVRFRAILPLLTAPDKILCQYFMGKKDSLLAQMMDSGLTNEKYPLDFSSRPQITNHRSQFTALDVLKEVPSAGYKCLLTNFEGDSSGYDLTPTLYELFVRKCVQDLSESYFYAKNDIVRIIALQEAFVEYYKQKPQTDANRAILIHEEITLAALKSERAIDLGGSRQAEMMGMYEDILSRYAWHGGPDSSRCSELARVYAKIARLMADRPDCNTALAYCDSAIARYAGSVGAAECRNIRQQILQEELSLYGGNGGNVCTQPAYRSDVMDGQPAWGLEYLTAKNVDKAYFRIVAMPSEKQKREESYYLKEKPLASWSQELGDSADHLSHDYYVYVPELPAGKYVLMASSQEDFAGRGFVTTVLVREEAAFRLLETTDSVMGYLLDLQTGAPISGQKVTLTSADWKKEVQTATTDADGFFVLPAVREYRSYVLQTTLRGHEVKQSLWGRSRRQQDYRDRKLFFDRPIYRPGDTVHFTILSTRVEGNRKGTAVAGDTLRCLVADPNRDTKDSVMLVTDAHGQATHQYVVDAEALPGRWSISAQGMYGGFVVEAYKQPKFAVTMDVANTYDKTNKPVSPQVGDTLVVEGTAASYAQVPLAGAMVKYSICRQPLSLFRGRPWNRGGKVTVKSDTITADAEGRFRIAFVAEGDTLVDKVSRTAYFYTVDAEVTDLDGETHSATVQCAVGTKAGYIVLDLPNSCDSLEALHFQYKDLNGNPITGRLQVRVDRLEVPKRSRMSVSASKSGTEYKHTMREEEFYRHYPLWAYDSKQCDMEGWPVAQTVYGAACDAEEKTQNSVSLPKLREGCYRVIVTDGSVSDTAYTDYMPAGVTEAHSSKLLWSDISTSKAEVGETVTVRVGSRYRDVWVLYTLAAGDNLLERRFVRLDDNVETLTVKVTEQMLGGFAVSLTAVKGGIDEGGKYHVSVPFTHKMLDVETATFRDKLAPGQQETYTFTISPKKRLGEMAGGMKSALLATPALQWEASLMLTMYDAALDSYRGRLQYAWSPWRSQTSLSAHYLSLSNYFYVPNFLHGERMPDVPSPRSPFFGWTLRTLYGDIYMDAYIESGKNFAVESVVASVGGVGYNDNANAMRKAAPRVAKAALAEVEVEEESVTVMEVSEMPDAILDEAPQPVPEVVHMRTNLSTLAFFEPQLRTDTNGSLVYSFTAPDLLTTWDLCGFAWTDDLATGTIEKRLVTQKPLMVQPNMPRFLREGDEAQLLAKVSNLTDTAMTVSVTFEFAIAGQPLQTGFRQLVLKPHAVESVTFPVKATVGGVMATYKIVARATNHSDGEQGPLPILTNRQAVTTSLSMFHNGTDTKHYALLLPLSSTAQPVGFTVEYTANPFWLAVQTLPFLSDRENPSTIYLANSLYVNTLGKTVADRYPELKQCAAEASDTSSLLFANADIKGTLLSETPWLRAGQNEAERLRRIASYYDADALQRQLKETADKLAASQLADGSWPWMPEGRYGSRYVTQYILRTLAPLAVGGADDAAQQSTRQPAPNQFSIKKALAYIDDEMYDSYRDIQKLQRRNQDLVIEPDGLDYLYTRSFYDAKLSKKQQEAYDFFYGNAKKHIDNYKDLYSQALLALVFQRHGDTKLAHTLVERIVEKALFSDEMGMYWRDNRSGWFYYQRPIETQALLIQAFREVGPDVADLFVPSMQQWLLKQKQTTSWNSDIATLHAIQALQTNGTDAGYSAENGVAILVEPDTLHFPIGKSVTTYYDSLATPKTGAGYIRHTYRADSLLALQGVQNIRVAVVPQRDGNGSGSQMGWGALYYQYTEQMDKVEASSMGITLEQKLYVVGTDGSLRPTDGTDLAVGDHVRLVLNMACDRNMEYVQLRRFRASCFEPVSTTSGWVWHGLSYYVAVSNSHDDLYINRLDKGKYVIESDYYVTNPGTFTLAPSVMQCLYAPEFRATTQGSRLYVK